MDKYVYIHHIINMLVLQKMHITGISHTDTSSRSCWGTMKKFSDDTRKTPENALSPSGRFPVSRRCCQKKLKKLFIISRWWWCCLHHMYYYMVKFDILTIWQWADNWISSGFFWCHPKTFSSCLNENVTMCQYEKCL